MPFVRLSRATFDAGLYPMVRKLLAASEAILAPGIRALPGCVHFWAGIDEEAGTMVNVSVWTTLAGARQLDTYEPMLAQGRVFSAAGVTFERPIVNYDVLWEFRGNGSGGAQKPVGGGCSSTRMVRFKVASWRVGREAQLSSPKHPMRTATRQEY